MWFKLASATFTNNLGTMSELSNSWPVSYSLSGGISKNSCPSSVAKNGAGTQAAANFTATFTLASGSTLNHIKAFVGGTQVGTTVTSGNSITIPAASITGPMTIEASATGASTGGDEPSTPVNPPSGESTTLSPYSVKTGFYLDASSKYQVQSSSSIVVYSVQPNSTYTLSVERKSGAAEGNANLIFAPAKSLNGLQVNGSPDFATGYDARIVEMSTNATNVLDYQFTTPADCIYLLLSNYQSGSTHTVVGIPGTDTPVIPDTPDVPEGTDIALTKAVDGVYLAKGANYSAEASSQVLCYAVSPNKTYVIGTPLDPTKQLVVCCVKSIDNIAAGNTATFATGWSDRQVGDANTNLTIVTPADCTHLVFSNYLKNQAPSYVKLVD